MPPKKPAKGKKGKGKAGKGKDKKGKKKGIKMNPKYAGMEFDYEIIGLKTRDELQMIAVNIQSDLDELRGDRILFQMQRDYFQELIQIYLEKIRNARDIPKLNRALRNAMVDETAYMKGGLTDKMVGNLDFVVSVNTAASEMRQLKRQNRIKKRIQDIYRNILDEMDEFERLARARPAEREAKIKELELELDNMQFFYDQTNEKQQKFLKELTKEMKRLYSDLQRMDYLDIDYVELHYNQLIYEFLNMMSWRYFMFKSTANDNVHNILTGIMLMMEHWDQLEDDCRFMSQNLELYAIDTEGLMIKCETMKSPYRTAKINHIQLERLRRGLRTSYRSTRKSEEDLHIAQERYKLALAEFAPIEEERSSFKAKLPFLTEDLWETYQDRYRIPEFLKKEADAVGQYKTVRRTHQALLGNPQEANVQFELARIQMQKKEESVERERLRSLRILKQHDDMARAVRARVRTIGHQGWRLKLPPKPEIIGARLGMGYAPAGLVARKAFPIWGSVGLGNCQSCSASRDAECYHDED